MERETVSTKFPIGSNLPKFNLKNVDGSFIGLDYFKNAPASLVVFSCNHCPYVKGTDEALIAIVKRFMPLGLKAVVINSNDASQYPEDSFDKMKEKASFFNLPYPYLYDDSQEVARLFDAQCTPECFLFDADKRLVFHGAINDSPREPSKVRKDFLSNAINQLLNGEVPAPKFAHPMGCSIKWKV